MSRRAKRFWNNPWTIGIGSSLVILIITLIIDFFTAEVIFHTIIRVFLAAWNAIIYFLNIQLKIWWILVFIIVGILILILIVRITRKNDSGGNYDFLEYTHDYLLDFKWNWTWEKNNKGEYGIRQLNPICPRCGTPLVLDDGVLHEKLICLRCKYTTDKELPREDYVEMLIYDNTKRKYFSNMQ